MPTDAKLASSQRVNAVNLAQPTVQTVPRRQPRRWQSVRGRTTAPACQPKTNTIQCVALFGDLNGTQLRLGQFCRLGVGIEIFVVQSAMRHGLEKLAV
jgi:hypothetical protein